LISCISSTDDSLLRVYVWDVHRMKKEKIQKKCSTFLHHLVVQFCCYWQRRSRDIVFSPSASNLLFIFVVRDVGDCSWGVQSPKCFFRCATEKNVPSNPGVILSVTCLWATINMTEYSSYGCNNVAKYLFVPCSIQEWNMYKKCLVHFKKSLSSLLWCLQKM